MPLLSVRDPLTSNPRRVLVAGTSGSGKTTLAAQIAATLGVPHIEIDGLFHGPSWTPRADFDDDVAAFSARPGWVTEWQYEQVRPLLAGRADLLVWLDVGRSTVLRQVLARTAQRRIRRQVLWNGNIEPPLRTLLTNRDHVVWWAWRTHAQTSERIHDLRQAHPELPVVRVRSRREAKQWLAGPVRAIAAR